uniref:Uncharacterized protein n=1 Tax=Plectus sambesii TaxID=2011161 RepID=A0A914XEI4_9BILA
MRPTHTLLLLFTAVVVCVNAKFYDFRLPDTFYRTSRRALRKTDWALRRRSRGAGRLFGAREHLSLSDVINGGYNDDLDAFTRETRRALRKTDWIRRPKKAMFSKDAMQGADDLTAMMRLFSQYQPQSKQRYQLAPVIDTRDEDKGSSYWRFPGRIDYKGQIPAMRFG